MMALPCGHSYQDIQVEQDMGWVGVFMQYSIYAALVLCALGLIASIALFIALEQRWQEGAERDVYEIMGRHLPQIRSSEDGLPVHPWEEMRNRIGERLRHPMFQSFSSRGNGAHCRRRFASRSLQCR